MKQWSQQSLPAGVRLPGGAGGRAEQTKGLFPGSFFTTAEKVVLHQGATLSHCVWDYLSGALFTALIFLPLPVQAWGGSSSQLMLLRFQCLPCELSWLGSMASYCPERVSARAVELLDVSLLMFLNTVVSLVLVHSFHLDFTGHAVDSQECCAPVFS